MNVILGPGCYESSNVEDGQRLFFPFHFLHLQSARGCGGSGGGGGVGFVH